MRRPEKSALVQRRFAIIMSSWAGTRTVSVMPSRSRQSKVASGSNLACSTTVQPACNAGVVRLLSPPTWNSGRVLRITSSPLRPCMSSLLAALQTMRALREQHTLGLAGGARGVTDQQRSFLVCYCIARCRYRVVAKEFVPWRPAGRVRAKCNEADAGQRIANGVGLGDEVGLDDQHLGRAVLQHLLVLGGGQAPVERHE